MNLTNVGAFTRLELADALRSRWVALTSLLYLVILGAFLWLGLRESSVLGFTGLSRVLLNVAHTIIVAFPLLVLFGTQGAVVRARTSGFFELMLAQPVQRLEWFMGLLTSRVAVLVGPLVVLLVGVGVAGAAMAPEAGLLAIGLRSAAITVSLVLCFIGIGAWLSAHARTPERAIVGAIAVWVVTAALHDVALIALLLRTPLPPQVVFFAAAVNPSEAARIGLLSAVDPELSVLGPVGFWLANTLGPNGSFALAVVWPLTLGALATTLAARRFRKSDVVG